MRYPGIVEPSRLTVSEIVKVALSMGIGPAPRNPMTNRAKGTKPGSSSMQPKPIVRGVPIPPLPDAQPEIPVVNPLKDLIKIPGVPTEGGARRA